MAINLGKKLGFGTLRLPILDPNDQASFDWPQLQQEIDLFMAHGFTYFDTSYVYHDYQSEVALRECLVKKYPRDAYLLSTKLPIKFMHKKEEVEAIFNEQLQKMGVDWLDFYLIHSINSVAYEHCKQWGVFEFLQQKQKEGKFKEFGVSLHDTPEFLDQILTEHPEINFVVLQLNYIDWENPTIRSREMYEVAVKHDKPIVVMEACKGGILANLPPEAEKLMKDYNPDASTASWAYRFCASLPGVRVVLSGMNRLEYVVDNIKTMEDFKPLNNEEYRILGEVVKIINAQTPIPCTGCKYCEVECPKKIDMSDYFALYNDYARMQGNNKENTVATQSIYYTNIIKHGRGAASDCIKCKKCMKVCPQRLDIPDYLVKVSQTFTADYNPVTEDKMS